MDTPIYIYPIWKTTYYALDEDVETVMYRIVAEDGEVIFTGRARKRPDEEYIFINLNKPCQNHIDSIITPGLGVRRSNGYRAFTLQFKFDGNDAGWDTWHEFAFYNDWSYEERSNGDDAPASVNQSEPINGHAAPGMFIPSTYVITGASEEICYDVEVPLEQQYLTFEFLEDGDFVIDTQTFNVTFELSYDSVTWEEYDIPRNDSMTIPVLAGEKVMLRNERNLYMEEPRNTLRFTNATASFNVYGNIMSLIYEDFVGKKTLPSEKTFELMFARTKVADASNLILPATALTELCYNGMFQECSSLTAAPELPATVLAEKCYVNMFFSCTSLAAAPALSATELTVSCYEGMFYNCTSLTEAPELPATVLAERCYFTMFGYCSSLTESPVLPAATLAKSCYWSMFAGCSSIEKVTCLATDISALYCTQSWLRAVPASGTFIKAASMSSWTRDKDGIPSGWTVINN